MPDSLARPSSSHESGPQILDSLGVIYIVVCCLWTVMVFAGLTLYLLNRQVDFVRMRNATVVTCTIVVIHVYLVLVLLLYPLNGAWPCDLEFWTMSIYFPLGIALFQAQVRRVSLGVADG